MVAGQGLRYDVRRLDPVFDPHCTADVSHNATSHTEGVPCIYVRKRHLVLRFAHPSVQGFVIDKFMKLPADPAQLQETGAWRGYRAPQAQRICPGAGCRRATKVVVLNRQSSRRRRPGPQPATDAGFEGEVFCFRVPIGEIAMATDETQSR